MFKKLSPPQNIMQRVREREKKKEEAEEEKEENGAQILNQRCANSEYTWMKLGCAGARVSGVVMLCISSHSVSVTSYRLLETDAAWAIYTMKIRKFNKLEPSFFLLQRSIQHTVGYMDAFCASSGNATTACLAPTIGIW